MSRNFSLKKLNHKIRLSLLFCALCFGGAMADESQREPNPMGEKTLATGANVSNPDKPAAPVQGLPGAAISCGYDSLLKILYVQNQELEKGLILARGQMSLMEMQVLTTKGELMIEADRAMKRVALVAGIAYVFLIAVIVGCK